jgi:hypothetical protein
VISSWDTSFTPPGISSIVTLAIRSSFIVTYTGYSPSP